MRTRPSAFLLALALAASVAPCAHAQSTPQAPSPAPQAQPDATTSDDDHVVQLSVTLVQVDAVVTDGDGKQVTDLQPSDFEVLEDGTPQKITDFSYVGERAATGTSSRTAGAAAPTGPSSPLRAEQVRRTIVLVVDNLSFEDFYYARRAIKTFVDEQMQPGDLVSIVQTRGGARSLQSFTSEKRDLYAAIEHIRWSPSFVTSDAPLDRDPNLDCDGHDSKESALDKAGGSSRGPGSAAPSGSPLDFDPSGAFRAESFTRGTLGVLNSVAQGLQDMPGRKAIVLLSDGFEIELGRCGYRIEKAMQGLIDSASRASVGIYTIDVRGVVVFSPSAAESISDATQIGALIANRSQNFFASQGILDFLAKQSGGTFTHGTNDIAAGIRRAADDQRGYYLIGYQPDTDTFADKDGKRDFHRLQVKVKRPGLKVRSRAGFYGVTDGESRGRGDTPSEQLRRAMRSPFGATGVRVDGAALYSIGAEATPSVVDVVHIDANDLTFVQTADGKRSVTLDVVVLLLNEYGVVVDADARSHEIQLPETAYRTALAAGIDYTSAFPVKRPGGYQLRAVVRDAASKRLGSVFQQIDVPDLKKNQLAVSTLMLGSSGGITMGSTAVRRFHLGDSLVFGLEVYNPKLDGIPKGPHLEMATKIYRDGESVYASPGQPIDVDPKGDAKRIQTGRMLQLGNALKPGSYILEVTVTDAATGKKPKSVTQWVDFDLE